MDTATELKDLKEDVYNYLTFLENQIIRFDMNDDRKDGDKYRHQLKIAKTYLDK